MNKIILIGRLVSDIYYNKTNNDIYYAKSSLAIDRWNQKETKTDFIPIIGWNKNAEIMNNFLVKGTLIAIEGTLITSVYQLADQSKITSFEVVIDKFQILETKEVIEKRRSNLNNANPDYKNDKTENEEDHNTWENFDMTNIDTIN